MEKGHLTLTEGQMTLTRGHLRLTVNDKCPSMGIKGSFDIDKSMPNVPPIGVKPPEDVGDK